MISKWRTVSRTLERWLATITRYIRDRRQIRLTQLSIDFYRKGIRLDVDGFEFNRSRVKLRCGLVWANFFFFITEASHAYDRYCGAYVLDRNELNIERTYVIGSREREREKKRNVVRMERNLKFGSKNLTSITTIIWFEKSRLRYFVFNLWYVNFYIFLFVFEVINWRVCIRLYYRYNFHEWIYSLSEKNPKNANTSGYITIRI